MAEFVFRTRPTIRPVALVLCLLFLAGCATIPKTAPTQFANFSTVTDKLSDDAIKVYDYTYSLQQATKVEQFIQSTDTKLSAISYELTYVNPNNLAFRKLLFNTLKTYAQSLKYIMSNEIDTTLDSEITTLSKKLSTLQTTLLSKVTLPSGITQATVSQAATKISDWLIAERKLKITAKSLETVTPAILKFVDIVKAEIGTCGITTDTSQYCVADGYTKDSNSIANTEICTSFQALIRANKETLTAQSKPGEIQNIHKIMINYRLKRDKACGMIAAFNAALDGYAKVVSSLPNAMTSKDTQQLSENIILVTQQLAGVESLLQLSTL